MSPRRTRITDEQVEDQSFISEKEFNDFFAQVVVTGTTGIDDTEVLTQFDNYLPGRGIFVGIDGTTVTTGTNTVTISGFETEFVAASGSLQTQIDAIVIDAAGVGSITASGVTVTGALTFESISGITLIPDAGTNTIVWSGTGVTSVSGVEGDIDIVGAGEVDVIIEGSTIVVSGTPHTEDTDTISDAIIGAGTVVVTSGTDTTTISGTPHTENTDTISDAIIGVGTVVVISGSDTTVVSGTPHTVNTDTISDALVAGHGITITSGTDTTTIASFDDDDVDSLTASGVTVTGSVLLETVGGISITADDATSTVTVSGGAQVGELIGNFFQIEFSSVGITNNTWLSVSSKDLTSNISPWPVVFPCRIAGLGYSNERDGSDCDIQIHVADAGSGNSNVLTYTFSVTDSRVAYKSDFGLSEIVLNPGDKVAIFGANAGDTRPKNMFLGLYVEIIARDDAEDSEDFSGDFS